MFEFSYQSVTSHCIYLWSDPPRSQTKKKYILSLIYAPQHADIYRCGGTRPLIFNACVSLALRAVWLYRNSPDSFTRRLFCALRRVCTMERKTLPPPGTEPGLPVCVARILKIMMTWNIWQEN